MQNQALYRTNLLVILLLCLAYTLPWAVNSTSGLTLNAYDLAEWLNLHPGTFPDRIPSFLLRGQLLLITALVAIGHAGRFTRLWWLRLSLGMLIVVAQLPPPEFMQMTGDPNQRQQAVLASASFIVLLLGLSINLRRFQRIIATGICLAGISTTLLVMIQVQPLMQDFMLSPQIGFGSVLFVLWYGAIIGAMWVAKPPYSENSP